MTYAKEGAAVLFGTYGVVLRLSDKEKKEFEAYVKESSERNRALRSLVVHERTYEVAQYSNSFLSIEEAHDTPATRYFNSKVNVSNGDERILTMLLTDLTFNDLYSIAKEYKRLLSLKFSKENFGNEKCLWDHRRMYLIALEP